MKLRRRRPTGSSPGPIDWKELSVTRQGNPGKGSRFRIAFQSEERSWEEEIDLAAVLTDALKHSGFEITSGGDCVHLSGSGIQLRPAIVSFQPHEEGKGTDSTTTIEISHPDAFPAVFEYQHSSGRTMEEAVEKGFSQWIAVDLPVFLDALRDKTETCTSIETLVARGSENERWKRIVLGPTMYTATAETLVAIQSDYSNHPAGCPCCFFARLREALKPLIESAEFAAVRLYMLRDGSGGIGADCRINGEQFEAGASMLKKYAKERPGTHFETRKQLIIIQNWFPRQDAPAKAEAEPEQTSCEPG